MNDGKLGLLGRGIAEDALELSGEVTCNPGWEIHMRQRRELGAGRLGLRDPALEQPRQQVLVDPYAKRFCHGLEYPSSNGR